MLELSLLSSYPCVDMPSMQVLDRLLGRMFGAVVDKPMHPAGRSITNRGCEI